MALLNVDAILNDPERYFFNAAGSFFAVVPKPASAFSWIIISIYLIGICDKAFLSGIKYWMVYGRLLVSTVIDQWWIEPIRILYEPWIIDILVLDGVSGDCNWAENFQVEVLNKTLRLNHSKQSTLDDHVYENRMESSIYVRISLALLLLIYCDIQWFNVKELISSLLNIFLLSRFQMKIACLIINIIAFIFLIRRKLRGAQIQLV